MLNFATVVVLLVISLAALQTEGKIEPRASPFFHMKMGPCRIGCAPLPPLGPPPPPPPPPPKLSLLVPPPSSPLHPAPQASPPPGPIQQTYPHHPRPTGPEAYKSYPHCDNSGGCRGSIKNKNLNKIDVSPVISVGE
ncbi:uncharacterized proline-rich protein-like [Penaeus monodon]|uniref:uncharacterized proline-rich protein-like n=1 Tax=Penaeus monodon TaxID=6687 RepID=UPI0018A7D638|nr:uncharacterized proline-rich protein-like [Penaeus monodon]